LDLGKLAARTPEEFIAIAVNLAGDSSNLAQIRRELRERMRQSPLTDALRFARNIEAIYRDVWRKWCGEEI
jgi:predicted O-linked N-acetylglucosamine transferase (SPINDLY family)